MFEPQMVDFKKYIIRLIAYSAIVLILLWLSTEKFNLTNIVWFGFIYLLIISAITYLVALSGLKKENKTFITRIYGSIGIRFIFSIFPLLIYLLFSKVKNVNEVIAYVLLYFFYTSFEIYHLVINLRPDSKRK
ncbi:MAG: hypothetical protein ACK4K9_08350 [Bacteroidia bacterium]